MENIVVSNMDISHLKLLRQNIKSFLLECALQYDKEGALILDIAPQIHEGAKEFFHRGKIQTLDIDKNSGTDFVADLTKNNKMVIPDNQYDIVVCTEVLEHTLNPFAAVNEIFRILKPSGVCLISVPFNLRIHGPLPDCWRFTEHGLRQLFKDFGSLNIKSLETKKRALMPIQYTLIAHK